MSVRSVRSHHWEVIYLSGSCLRFFAMRVFTAESAAEGTIMHLPRISSVRESSALFVVFSVSTKTYHSNSSVVNDLLFVYKNFPIGDSDRSVRVQLLVVDEDTKWKATVAAASHVSRYM